MPASLPEGGGRRHGGVASSFVSVGSPAYVVTLVLTAVLASALVLAGRRLPAGAWQAGVSWGLGLVLVATSAAWFGSTVASSRFSVATSLPFALCDLAALVAAAALFTRQQLLVEITYFWGLAGTLQALVTPDLAQPFPSLVFFEYVIGHAAIVCAALWLVAGLGLAPRQYSVLRVWCVTVAYSGVVGMVDAITGGNYMYLRKPPGEWTLLRVLGPWPWYIASAAGVAFVLFGLLDLPWWLQRHRRRPGAPVQPTGAWGDGTRRRSAFIDPASQTDARLARSGEAGWATDPAGPEGALPAPAVRNTSSGEDPK
jgi:hypothetical integral membrane protein (TIGR02206 family)